MALHSCIRMGVVEAREAPTERVSVPLSPSRVIKPLRELLPILSHSEPGSFVLCTGALIRVR